jgi:hypothetical protein
MAGVTTPVESPNAYANDEDLSAFWKPITADDEKARANSLLKLASNRLRTISTQQGHGDMDELVNGDPAYFVTVQWVVMEATKRAMLTPTDLPPVDTYQQTAGPYSENIKYTNPSGDLWFKKSELHDLGLYGNQKLSSIKTTTADIYGS